MSKKLTSVYVSMLKMATLYTDVKSTGNMWTSEFLNPGLKNKTFLEQKLLREFK